MILLLIFLGITIMFLLWENITMAFKNAYYEQTLENNKDKFSEKRYKQIEDIKAKRSPF